MLKLKSYLFYSAAVHAALVVFLLAAIQKSSKPEQIYRIDFIGSTASILNRELEGGPTQAQGKAAPGSRPPPLSNPDAFPRHPHRPLPRPSVLGSEEKPAPEPEPKKEAAPEGGGETSKPAQGAQGQGGPSVLADMPNFPYPWYLATVRSALWEHWSHAPQAGGECTVIFSILRNGNVVDLRVESSSGDESQDYAAVSAVQASAPFPPLPAGFEDPFLKVHVQFKAL